ncbi:hypothetical protein [uncultured Kordia sp.]|uniref:hypothetical protein n=1 Tax=uncultured Kordia sp. TaxID=507699 RepID=UPI00260AE65E|nr:hypothetical protein [uncultured Kordia sp.]
MNILEVIIFASSVVFGISIYWLESKNNKLYRFFNKLFNSKELQIPANSKKGFIIEQGFMPRFIYINIFLIFVLIVVLFLPIIKNIGIQYQYVSALIGIMIGIYLGNFMISIKDKSEEIIDQVVDTGKEIIDDLKTKGKEAVDSLSDDKKAETTEEKTTEEPEAPKKSARERLKDKGLIK